MAPNKTLAAQLYSELRELFPDNAVEYFVSYYDYYQPEAYVPSSDTYIEKDAIINDRIDRMRHSATRALLSRRDVIIVASVSCIYGIGSAERYRGIVIELSVGEELRRDELLRRLVDIQYARNDVDFHRGTFRVRGDVVEIFPVHEEDVALRIEYWGDEIEAHLRGRPAARQGAARAQDRSPSSRAATTSRPRSSARSAINSIREELRERSRASKPRASCWRSQRLEQRTMYDLEMLEQMGFCHGIENYSPAPLGPRSPGQPPPTLLDYFPSDFLVVLDESHQTSRRSGPCTKAIARAKRRSWRTASACRARSTTGRCKFEEFESATDAGAVRERHAGRIRARADAAACSSSRSSAPRASSTPR
jgi:excinuclease ABC subunit B